MKRLMVLFLVVSTVYGCKETPKETEVVAAQEQAQKGEVDYKSFGKKINTSNVIDAEEMYEAYASMNVGDSMDVKVMAKVNAVCQAKGCWMKLDLGNGEEAMVKFKDYGFFMPKDIAGEDVIVNGKAFVNEVPVDEQRHYAEDGGATQDEIAQITEPKKTFSFEADGALLKAK